MAKRNALTDLAKVIAEDVPKSASSDTHTSSDARVLSINGGLADCQLTGRPADEESLILRDVIISDSCKWIAVSEKENEPLKVGDLVLINFVDHDITNLNSKGYTYDSDRNHDLSDGIIGAVIQHG
ncbi:hypothetical protein [Secundilactobacillus yichangensis]|uniref:hypothetical protein n=1 Tax=Secundilactobacillus yichangensis TaxID=2799580 RepID=UPI001945B40A|nr:hypothetical protein [Secundilactobacillus yichangensis]